jgi:hypothetical protein
MEKLLARLLGPLVEKIPTGWKTVTGLLAYLAIATVASATDLDQQYPDAFTAAETVAFALFGFGIIHKSVKSEATQIPTSRR